MDLSKECAVSTEVGVGVQIGNSVMERVIHRFWSFWGTVIGPRSLALPCLVLSIGLCLTHLLLKQFRTSFQTASQVRFERLTDKVIGSISERIRVHEQVLRSIRGLYSASDHVSRNEMRQFVASIERPFYGELGYGFVRRVRRDSLDEFLRVTRAEGAPDFEIKTTGDHAELFITEFIEPLSDNLAAQGFDVALDKRRSEAARESVRRDQAVLSDRIQLVQDKNKGSGFLLFLPIFKRGMPTLTEEQRWTNLLGWAYAPLRMDALLRGITERVERQVDFQIFDKSEVSTEACLYDMDAHPLGREDWLEPDDHSKDGHLAKRVDLELAGQQWMIHLTTRPEFLENTHQGELERVVILGGVVISVMGAAIGWALTQGRRRALALAHQITDDLRMENAVRVQAEADANSAREVAERALREVETQKVAMDLHAIVSVTDPAGNLLYANDQFCRVSGYRWDELRGKNHRIINSSQHSREFWAAFWGKISRGDTWEGEICNRSKNGSLYWLKTTVVPFRDGKGAIEKYVAIRTDITDQKRREEELVRMREAAEAATRAKSNFLATMSHEIRTPMNGVLGFANLLQETSLNETQRGYLDVLLTSGRGLLTVINDILDYSKIEAGKLEIKSVEFDLEQAVGESVELMAARAEDKKLALVLDYPTELPRLVHGDPARVRQILLNLIGNAVKFTQQGHIHVTVSAMPAAEGQTSSSGIRIEITDTGIGIARETQTSLFEKFMQGDGSSSRRYGGTGLGLAISRHLVNLMGGQIGMKSELGKGSSFWLSLPAAVVTSSPRDAFKGAAWKEARVLVVSDTEGERRVMASHLSSWGVSTTSVTGGSEALAELQQAQEDGKPFHILFVSKDLPSLDGERLGKTIRELSNHDTVALVLMTSYSKRGESKDCTAQGFCAYLVAPLIRDAALRQVMDVAWRDHESRCGGGEGLRLRPVEGSAPEVPSVVLDAPRDTGGQEGNAVQILLVEDTVINQKLATKFLEKLGCKVDLAIHGREAVEKTQRNAYDLIFMDCHMPEMDGFEATRLIRGHESAEGGGRHVPIVALTAGAMLVERDACFSSGMDGFVTKPFSSKDLKEALDQWCTRRLAMSP